MAKLPPVGIPCRIIPPSLKIGNTISFGDGHYCAPQVTIGQSASDDTVSRVSGTRQTRADWIAARCKYFRGTTAAKILDLREKQRERKN